MRKDVYAIYNSYVKESQDQFFAGPQVRMIANDSERFPGNLGGGVPPNNYTPGGPVAGEDEIKPVKKATIVDYSDRTDPVVLVSGYGQMKYSQLKKKITDHITGLAYPALAFNIEGMDEKYNHIKYLVQAAADIDKIIGKKKR